MTITAATTDMADPDTRPITYAIGEWHARRDTTRVRVILDASGEEALEIYTYRPTGSEMPEMVWHRRHITIATVPGDTVPAELERELRAHEDEIRLIAERYRGTRWDGRNVVGDWDGDSEDDRNLLELPEIASYWDAAEYLAGDSVGVVRDAVHRGSVETAAAAEVAIARGDGVWLDVDETERAIRDLLEGGAL